MATDKDPQPDADAETDDDSSLFRQAMRDVNPLHATPKVLPGKPRPAPRAIFSRAAIPPEDDSPESSPNEIHITADAELSFARPGVQQRVMRKLKRGEFPIEAELDLHGMTADMAGNTLREFLSAAVARGLRCVRIIHGKGMRSGERGPVLKIRTAAVLAGRPDVLAWHSARPADGGTGAVIVLLRRG